MFSETRDQSVYDANMECGDDFDHNITWKENISRDFNTCKQVILYGSTFNLNLN